MCYVTKSRQGIPVAVYNLKMTFNECGDTEMHLHLILSSNTHHSTRQTSNILHHPKTKHLLTPDQTSHDPPSSPLTLIHIHAPPDQHPPPPPPHPPPSTTDNFLLILQPIIPTQSCTVDMKHMGTCDLLIWDWFVWHSTVVAYIVDKSLMANSSQHQCASWWLKVMVTFYFGIVVLLYVTT